MSLYHKLDPVIMRHDKLSPQSKLVYYALVTFWNEKTKKCFPKMKTISSLTGLSYSTVRRSIAELARLKVIIVHRLRSTQSYTLPLQSLFHLNNLLQFVSFFEVQSQRFLEGYILFCLFQLLVFRFYL